VQQQSIEGKKSMNIRIKLKERQFIITSDDRQFVLSEEKIAEKGKNPGNVYVVDFGYYAKLENLLEAMILLELSQSEEITTLEELVQELRSIKTELTELIFPNKRKRIEV